MRLRELNAKLISVANYKKTEVQTIAEAILVEFDCPGCAGKPWSHRIWAPFLGKYDTLGPAWRVHGSTLDDLTFVDDGPNTRSIRMLGGCKSHFNVTGGAIDFYGDSGHSTYHPEISMPPTSDAPAPQTQAPADAGKPASEAPKEHPVVESAPAGFGSGGVLKYLSGQLHQLFHNPHPNVEPTAVWVPVPGTSIPGGLMHAVEEFVAERFSKLEARVKELEARVPQPVS